MLLLCSYTRCYSQSYSDTGLGVFAHPANADSSVMPNAGDFICQTIFSSPSNGLDSERCANKHGCECGKDPEKTDAIVHSLLTRCSPD